MIAWFSNDVGSGARKGRWYSHEGFHKWRCVPERVWLMCKPATRSRESRVASLFLRATALFSYIFIFWRFQVNVNVFLSKWFTWQKKHKLSIFFRAWNSAQVVAVICWRSDMNEILSFPRTFLYQNFDYVKLPNIQIYTGKRSSEANFRWLSRCYIEKHESCIFNFFFISGSQLSLVLSLGKPGF